MNCPNCNTPNSESARWCALCLEKFDGRPNVFTSAPPIVNVVAPPPAPVYPPQPMAPPPAPVYPPQPTSQLLERPSPTEGRLLPPRPPLRKVGDELVWTCPSCARDNSFDQNNCGVCGASLYDMFRTPVETHRAQDQNPNIAAALSLIPGGGHLYLRQVGQGIIRMTLGAWWLLSAIFIAGANKLLDFIQYMFWIAFIGLIVVSVLDARALADDPDATQFLTGKVVRYAALTLAAAAVLGMLTALVAGR